MKLLIINGPNINFLGIREKSIYGVEDYDYLCKLINDEAEKNKIEVSILQSNIEGEIINFIQQAYLDSVDGIIINPGAYTHYSYAIFDALKSVNIPAVEVHISNIHSREEFRHKSITAGACQGIIGGFGLYGYIMAINYFINEGKK